MKTPIDPTPAFVRVARAWRRECARLDRMNELGLEFAERRAEHQLTSHHLAEMAVASLVLAGHLPITQRKKARRKK